MIHLQNCTAQNQLVLYRLDFKDEGQAVSRSDRVNFRRLELKPWSSGRIDCEASMAQDVLDQLARYGHHAQADVPNRLVGVVPVIWNLDQPVNLQARQAVIEHNRSHKAKEGQERRKKAAIAANNAVIQNLDQTGQPLSAAPNDFEVEVEQTPESETEFTENRLTEGFRVQASPQGPGRGGRRAKAA